jgi:hypothetical protein
MQVTTSKFCSCKIVFYRNGQVFYFSVNFADNLVMHDVPAFPYSIDELEYLYWAAML